MSVQISELEIVPRPGETAQRPEQQEPQQQHAPSPELAHEIARTVAVLHSRDLRLRAD